MILVPVFDPEDRRSYRLTGVEVGAVWGLSHELLTAVEEGLGAAVAAGRAASALHAKAEFERRQGRRKGPVLDLLGFGMARPLLLADRVLLADRMLLEVGELECAADPVDLYRVSDVLERTREAMGATRRRLVKGSVDPLRCYSLLAMATTRRPKVVTLRAILHSAWRRDSVAVAAGLAARWPLAMAGGCDVEALGNEGGSK